MSGDLPSTGDAAGPADRSASGAAGSAGTESDRSSTTRSTVSSSVSSTVSSAVEEHWNDLVTVALLGTDRRDPPAADGPIAELVADTARSAPSERMLAQVAACVAVRRAGFMPGPVGSPLVPPPDDDRPVCVPAAAERWVHITASWPVLEDEWVLTLITNGWRAAPELVPAMLRRHRRDPVRRARAVVAAGPIAAWLVEHVAGLAGAHPAGAVSPEALAELPTLPIPPDLAPLIGAPGARSGSELAAALGSGVLGQAHRAVLVNLVARVRSDSLAELAERLGTLDPMSPGYGLASTLADLAVTRHRMLDELTPPRFV